ncbi:hypothetical protein CIHG_02786 [Coccidioides immitis H538.4]|uniref:Uncharacterized protein n=3 Tax=Coccidioides immitis TaxID=5501 RepID=A0A0J8QKM0_COCIT|nr:hypothetical protein CIRG_07502 [Coccidioides immitis RMSCC 2394]KMU71718.1 hypothetical protein CISG_00028 [Coccidioides immitis RMSCC 3703]KMU85003.1 hypothetical protein CIHG_02786 [Coccidioides immitis H538.4]
MASQKGSADALANLEPVHRILGTILLEAKQPIRVRLLRFHDDPVSTMGQGHFHAGKEQLAERLTREKGYMIHDGVRRMPLNQLSGKYQEPTCQSCKIAHEDIFVFPMPRKIDWGERIPSRVLQ